MTTISPLFPTLPELLHGQMMWMRSQGYCGAITGHQLLTLISLDLRGMWGFPWVIFISATSRISTMSGQCGKENRPFMSCRVPPGWDVTEIIRESDSYNKQALPRTSWRESGNTFKGDRFEE